MIDFTSEDLQKMLTIVNREKPIFLVKLFPIHDYGFFAFESSSDKEIWVPCNVSEKRYPLSDNYKITMTPMQEGYGLKHFYISDFVYMVKSESVLVLDQSSPWQDQVPPTDEVEDIFEYF